MCRLAPLLALLNLAACGARTPLQELPAAVSDAAALPDAHDASVDRPDSADVAIKDSADVQEVSIPDVAPETATECTVGQTRCKPQVSGYLQVCVVPGVWKDDPCPYLTPVCKPPGTCTFLVADGLVAFYPLDGDGKEALGSGYDATPLGSTQWLKNRFGLQGRAAWPSANAYLTVNHPQLPVGAAPRSLALWLLHTSPPPADWSLAATWGSSATKSAEFGLGMVSLYAGFTGHYNDVDSEPKSLAVETWHFLVATYDGTVLELYVDDQLMKSITLSLKTKGTGLVFGRDNLDDTYPGFWSGGIDDVRIYNRVLTKEEVHTLYVDDSK